MSGCVNVVGLDLGKERDPTAMVLLEKQLSEVEKQVKEYERRGGRLIEGKLFDDNEAEKRRLRSVRGVKYEYVARHIERFPLGQPWGAVVDRVCEAMSDERLVEDSQLVIDYTGVGSVVFDMFRGSRPAVHGILFTGGEKATLEGAVWHVPKQDLVALLQVAVQNQMIHVPKSVSQGPLLAQELQNCTQRITKAGSTRYGTPDWREQEHDDIVFATAIALWYSEKGHRTYRFGSM